MKKIFKRLYDNYLIRTAILYETMLKNMPYEDSMWEKIWLKAWWLSLKLQDRNIEY